MKSLTKILFVISIFVLSCTTIQPAKPDFEYMQNLHWLALNIYYESGNQPTLGKMAVGVVTLNRTRDSRFSDTIESVVKEYKQFSWYNPKKKIVIPDNDAWYESVEIAKILLKLESDSDIMKLFDGATHFHATYVNPAWKKSMIKIMQIGDHVFYKSKPTNS